MGSYYYSLKGAEALNMNHYHIGRDGFRSDREVDLSNNHQL